nr:hypothetical protein CFP56_24770 [Quercus suber]
MSSSGCQHIKLLILSKLPYKNIIPWPPTLHHALTPAGRALQSCQVFKHVWVFLVSLQIVTGDQIFNSLLYCFDIRLHISIH